MTRVLVFGSSGQLAQELRRAAWGPEISVNFLGRDAANFLAPQSLPGIVSRERPDAIIIAAAYTAVDRAEGDEQAAFTVNAEAPAVISAEAERHGVPVLYVSTDYVFDGRKEDWYGELDDANPLNAYGRSKLAGETAVSSANPHHMILRTSWLYSAFGSNFVRTMVHFARTREKVEVVADQLGCPTAAGDLAGAIAQLVPMMLDSGARFGTYHLAGRSDTTWHGFAERIFELLAERGTRCPQNLAITSADYHTAAARPKNSRLSSRLFAERFGIRLPAWQESLPRIVQEIASS